MKTGPLIEIIWLTLAVALLLESCSAKPLATERIETPTLERTTPSATSRYLPTRVVPKVTPTPPAPSATHTPTIQVTPTLSLEELFKASEERARIIVELIKTKTECDLPCWWGIVPGKTTGKETEQYLNEVGLTAYHYELPDGTTGYSVGGNDFEKENLLSIEFYEKSGFVDSIKIRSDGHNLEGFQQIWEAYQPRIIIQKYGKPSRIWIRSNYSYGRSERRAYALLFFYDHLGFLIEYSGVVEFKPTYHICPWTDESEDVQVLYLYLQSPDNRRPLEKLTPHLEYPEYVKPIEAGGLSVDDIYALFLEEEQPCFDFPGEIFP